MNIGHGVVFSDFSKNHNREKKYISRDFSTHDKRVDNLLAETQSEHVASLLISRGCTIINTILPARMAIFPCRMEK